MSRLTEVPLTRGLVRVATRMRLEGKSQLSLGQVLGEEGWRHSLLGQWLLMEADAIDRERVAILHATGLAPVSSKESDLDDGGLGARQDAV